MHQHHHFTWNDILWMVFHSEESGLWQLDLARLYLDECPNCRAQCDGLMEMLEAGALPERLDFFELQLKYSRWRANKAWTTLDHAAHDLLRQRLKREAATYGMVDLLIDESHKQASIQWDRALLLAEAAMEMAYRLPVHAPEEDTVEGPFDSEAVDVAARTERLALAHAVLGNAYRKKYRFDEAEAAFCLASNFLGEMEEDDASTAQGRTRVLSLKASLLIDVRQLEEAIDTLAEAAEAARMDRRTPHTLAAEIAINRSVALGLANRNQEALDVLLALPKALGSGAPQRLRFALRHRLAEQYVWAGDLTSARAMLHDVQDLCDSGDRSHDELRVAWLEGRIEAGEGNIGQALEIFRTVQERFLQEQALHEAALLALEIAAALYALGDSQATAEHAQSAFALFVPLRLQDEMLGALALLAHAADRGQVTTELLRALIRYAQGGELPERKLWM